MNLTVLIPTRDRQKLLAKTVETLVANIELDGTRIIIGWDEDEAIGEWGPLESPIVRYSRMPREDTLGAKYNRLYANPIIDNDDNDDNGVAMLWADDMTIASKGFDRRICDAAKLFTDGIGLVFFGKVEGVLQPGIAVTDSMIYEVGRLCEPEYAFWWQDTRWIEIGRMTGRIVEIDGIDVKCLGEMKGQSRGVRDIAFWGQYFDATRPKRIAIANRIIDNDDDAPFRKYQLRRQLPYWERMFLQQNEKCSNPVTAKQLEEFYSFDAPANDRYLRVKKAAELELENLRKKAA